MSNKITRADLVRLATVPRADLQDLADAPRIDSGDTLRDWVQFKTDQPITWQVLRVLSCRVHYLRYEGQEGPQWTRDRMSAWCCGDRETVYQTARRVQGLLVLYDR